MPELPEVEVTRQGLAPAVVGQRIDVLRLGKPLRWPLGVLPDELVGRRVVALRRRGKYILMDLDRGLLLWHLGMSGRLDVGVDLPPVGRHDHVILCLGRLQVRLHDPRRFGALIYAQQESDPVVQKLLGHLGVEPLGDAFTTDDFAHALKARRGPIKPALMAGDIVVGVGNIYASETLFRAGIHPARRAHAISRARMDALHAAIRAVLTRAIAAGGSSLKDFRHADGALGYFQLETRVYEREGLPCFHCQTPIRRVVQAQRSTYYCPKCQR